MEDNITLILHHGDSLERDEYQMLQYVRGEFCVWKEKNMLMSYVCGTLQRLLQRSN